MHNSHSSTPEDGNGTDRTVEGFKCQEIDSINSNLGVLRFDYQKRVRSQVEFGNRQADRNRIMIRVQVRDRQALVRCLQ